MPASCAAEVRPVFLQRSIVTRFLKLNCIYMPRATGNPAGFTEDELVEDAVALLGSGTNIVTTCTDLLARGARLSDTNRARVLEACKNGNSHGFVGLTAISAPIKRRSSVGKTLT